MNGNLGLWLLQLRVLFPLIAFAAVGIASEGTWGWTAHFVWGALPLYLFAPLLPRLTLRRKLLPEQPPAAVVERWQELCQEIGVEAELRLVPYGSANGVAVGGRRRGIAALSPEALQLAPAEQELLLRHLALQLRMGMARHTARATLLWLYSAAYVMILGLYAWWTDDNISLLGLILAELFGLYFLGRSAGFGHEAKRRVDEAQLEAGAEPGALRALIERVIRESPTFLEVSTPTFTGPLWFALPQDAKEKGEAPAWDSLTKERFKALKG